MLESAVSNMMLLFLQSLIRELSLLKKEVLKIFFQRRRIKFIFLIHFWRLQSLKRQRMRESRVHHWKTSLVDVRLLRSINIDHEVAFVILDVI